jgi:hypothetical protein
MTVQGSPSTEMLPAGVPVIDHLAAWISVTPGWNIISPVITELCTKRSPKTEARYHPEVFELALDTATDKEYVHACEWIKQKHQKTREKYGILLPAADVECLQVQASKDYQSLEQILADIVLSSGERSHTFKLPPPPSRGASPGKAISLPVLYM